MFPKVTELWASCLVLPSWGLALLGGGWAGTEHGGWRSYGIRAPGPRGGSASGRSPGGGFSAAPEGPSSTSSRAISVPALIRPPCRGPPGSPRWPAGQGRGRQSAGLAEGAGGARPPNHSVQRGVAASGPPKARARGWGGPPRWQDRALGGRHCLGTRGLSARVGAARERASQQQGARGPSGPAPWAGRQGRSPAAEAQAGLQLQPGNRSRAERHAAPGCSGDLKLPRAPEAAPAPGQSAERVPQGSRPQGMAGGAQPPGPPRHPQSSSAQVGGQGSAHTGAPGQAGTWLQVGAQGREALGRPRGAGPWALSGVRPGTSQKVRAWPEGGLLPMGPEVRLGQGPCALRALQGMSRWWEKGRGRDGGATVTAERGVHSGDRDRLYRLE